MAHHTRARLKKKMSDDVDLKRLGLLLLAAVDASRGGYVLIRLGSMPLGQREVRVNVRHGADEHTSRSHAPIGAPAVTEALDRALDWLRRQPAPDP